MPDNLAPLMNMINSQFEQLHKRLDVIDAKNEQRDLRVNTMDKENKAEIASIRKEVDAVKTLWKAACWVGGGIVTLFSIGPEIVKLFHKAS